MMPNLEIKGHLEKTKTDMLRRRNQNIKRRVNVIKFRVIKKVNMAKILNSLDIEKDKKEH